MVKPGRPRRTQFRLRAAAVRLWPDSASSAARGPVSMKY